MSNIRWERQEWLIIFLMLCFLVGSAVRSQLKPVGEAAFAARFARLLIDGSDSLSSMVDPEESELSSRLGIQYDGVPHKYLIGFDFDEQTKQLIRSGARQCLTSVENLPEGFSVVKLEVPGHGGPRLFYFNARRQLISPVYFHARHWSRRESPHFSFWISDPALFHPEAMNQLESFLGRVAGFLRYSEDDMRQLARQKIIYVLCRDENEIERLTGFKSRGMYMLAYDYVTTTYSCHFHELMHLLMNFKLRKLPLYTHPLLQEGLAVAWGGRGGIAAPSLQQSGVFLCQTGSLNYTDILSTQSFHSVDPSLTYPVSGIYVRFLVDRRGIDRFLELYRTYSGDGEHVATLALDTTDLPPQTEWQSFVSKVSKDNPIQVSADGHDEQCILADSSIRIWESGRYYHVRMKPLVALRPGIIDRAYTSKRFTEVCPGRNYSGERFLFAGDTTEVTIYDLYTNNSIAGYSSGFSTTMDKVKQESEMLEFWVVRDVFAEPLKAMQVVTYDH